MQTKECPITGDSKHDDLFHKKVILAYNQLKCKGNLSYRQEDLIMKQVENLINITLLCPTL